MESLIFGFKGQLGHALAARLPDATGVDRASCDITRADQVEAVTTASAPAMVFNAAAYNLVDKAEAEPDAALAVNGVAPGRLAAAARRAGSRFMHFSTDYVFGDGYNDPIDETRPPAPMSTYGRSKLLGEQLALQNNPETFIVRTTGVYSARRQNFVKTMIRHAVAGTKLTVVSDQLVSPTWVDSLADVAIALAETDVCGVYHVTAQGGCSWYTLAARIFEILDLPADLHPIDQASWGAAATRPRYSVLDDAMLRATDIARIGRWDDELERFLVAHGADLVAQAENP